MSQVNQMSKHLGQKPCSHLCFQPRRMLIVDRFKNRELAPSAVLLKSLYYVSAEKFGNLLQVKRSIRFQVLVLQEQHLVWSLQAFLPVPQHMVPEGTEPYNPFAIHFEDINNPATGLLDGVLKCSKWNVGGKKFRIREFREVRNLLFCIKLVLKERYKIVRIRDKQRMGIT
ncbi:hypothetical protein SADUNF_Sadunf03G0149100 [Salix dunnii]|uniref:Uncharacterized protein n=1 Tax=Salix dunnii TaxID=1413687 RepID=A0A835N4X7_9ROSI|nr:hypothetical protein SADUNF_Sadunf03G0149100 [Salix dunnii]